MAADKEGTAERILLPSREMHDHSCAGNSYWPLRMRFFMPGEMGAPWLL